MIFRRHKWEKNIETVLILQKRTITFLRKQLSLNKRHMEKNLLLQEEEKTAPDIISKGIGWPIELQLSLGQPIPPL
jgi:hypothetical protein